MARRLALAAWTVTVLAILGWGLVRQTSDHDRLTGAAQTAAQNAGCSAIRTVPSQGRAHLTPGTREPTYSTSPPTSGPHDPNPLPPSPRVYSSAPDPGKAVHNLEHGYLEIYLGTHGARVTDGVRAVLDQLASGNRKVLVFTQVGPPGIAGVGLAAWGRLQTCPSSITPAQASSVARGFIHAMQESPTAPEPGGR